jgi:hypothetical protein
VLPLLTMVLATIAVPMRQQRSAVMGTRNATGSRQLARVGSPHRK